MAVKFEEGDNPIAGIAVGEFKITRIGPAVGEILRVAYLSRIEGVTCGECTFHGPWSEQTQQLIDMLCESLENDTIAFLRGVEEGDLNGSVVGDDEDADLDDEGGLTFG